MNQITDDSQKLVTTSEASNDVIGINQNKEVITQQVEEKGKSVAENIAPLNYNKNIIFQKETIPITLAKTISNKFANSGK